MVPRTRADAAAVPIPRRRFTVAEYHRMGEAGVLGEDDRVELLDGTIVEMSPIGRPHASTVARLNALLVRRFGHAATVRVQNPIVLDRWSEPQPKAELREVWLVDPKAEAIDIHRRPALRGFREHRRYVRGRTIVPLAFPRHRIRVNEILG